MTARLRIGGRELDAAQWSKVSDYAALKLWSRGDDVRWLQQRLTEAGFDTQGIDGVFGHATQVALQAWQTAHGYAPTGEMTAAQAWAMLR